MILGHGIDLLHLHRIRTLTARQSLSRLTSRIMTLQEQQDLHQLMNQYKLNEPLRQYEMKGNVELASKDLDVVFRRVGATWAVKEAMYKAVYPQMKLSWKDMSYLKVNGQSSLLSLCGS